MLTRLLLSTALVAMTLPVIASSSNARSKPAEIVVVGNPPKSVKNLSLPKPQRLFRISGGTMKHSGKRGGGHTDFLWHPRGRMQTNGQIQRAQPGAIANYRRR
jgi:hypothetical protein